MQSWEEGGREYSTVNVSYLLSDNLTEKQRNFMREELFFPISRTVQLFGTVVVWQIGIRKAASPILLSGIKRPFNNVSLLDKFTSQQVILKEVIFLSFFFLILEDEDGEEEEEEDDA